MIGFTALKTRKPRQFEYKPRHYDYEMEEREKRKKQVLADKWAEEGKNKEDYEPGKYIQDMRIRRGIIAERQKEKKKRGYLRLLIVLALTLLVAYLFLFR